MRKTLEILTKADRHDTLVKLYRERDLKLLSWRLIQEAQGSGYPLTPAVSAAYREFHDAGLAFDAAMKEAANV
jgi:hypothetical protein